MKEIRIIIKLPEGAKLEVEQDENLVSEAEARAPEKKRKERSDKGKKKSEEPADEEMTEVGDDVPDEDFGDDFADEESDKLSDSQLKELKRALNVHAQKGDRKATVKILHKYAKVSDEVKPADLAKLLKELSK